MGFLDFFRKKQPQQPTNRPATPSTTNDLRKAECPYCRKPLKKVPGSKTKCPHCEQYMFVRTRPKENARVVVTQEEANQIDEDWASVTGTHDQYLAVEQMYRTEKEILRKRFGTEPSDNDVKWSLLNKKLLEHSQMHNWGLYRNNRFDMAEILRREMKLEHALRTYLEVCYLDLNGPNNTGGINDPEVLALFPPFDPKDQTLAPGVIDLIERIMSKLSLSIEIVESMFMAHNDQVWKSLNLPAGPKECWPFLKSKLESHTHHTTTNRS